jgi:hypothetical protein
MARHPCQCRLPLSAQRSASILSIFLNYTSLGYLLNLDLVGTGISRVDAIIFESSSLALEVHPSDFSSRFLWRKDSIFPDSLIVLCAVLCLTTLTSACVEVLVPYGGPKKPG